MRNSHLYLFGVAAVTLGFVAATPGAALAMQDEPAETAGPSTATASDMTPDQKADFDSWPVEKQTEYELWPAETKAYYWSLSAERQMLFWRLSDEDKIALTAMTGPEREAVWLNIESSAAVSSGES